MASIRCGKRAASLSLQRLVRIRLTAPTDCLRAGADGFVLAPDMIDYSKKAFDFWQAGDHIEAEVTYGEVLPAIVFAMQSIEHLICYGKRIFGHRSGIPIHDRAPALRSTEFGENSARMWADRLGSLTG